MSLIEEALMVATNDAERARVELEAHAVHAVTLVQDRVRLDGGLKCRQAGTSLMGLIAVWATEWKLTPGEAALVLSSAVTGTLANLPGMTADLARAITIEFARGPRSE